MAAYSSGLSQREVQLWDGAVESSLLWTLEA